jgi:hypothetical protein
MTRSRSLVSICLIIVGCALWFLAWDQSAPHAKATLDQDAVPSARRERADDNPKPEPVTARTSPSSQVAAAAVTAAPQVPAAPAVPPPAPQKPEHRPDDLTAEERAERARERTVLTDRWARQEGESNPNARDEMHQALGEALTNEGLDPGSISSVDCRRSLCRLELATTAAGQTPLAEVKQLIHATRQLPETWLLASEIKPGAWQVEAFASIEGYHLTGDHVE